MLYLSFFVYLWGQVLSLTKRDTQVGIHKTSNVVEYMCIDTTVSTADREASPQHGYVAQVQMKCEKTIVVQKPRDNRRGGAGV